MLLVSSRRRVAESNRAGVLALFCVARVVGRLNDEQVFARDLKGKRNRGDVDSFIWKLEISGIVGLWKNRLPTVIEKSRKIYRLL